MPLKPSILESLLRSKNIIIDIIFKPFFFQIKNKKEKKPLKRWHFNFVSFYSKIPTSGFIYNINLLFEKS